MKNTNNTTTQEQSTIKKDVKFVSDILFAALDKVKSNEMIKDTNSIDSNTLNG